MPKPSPIWIADESLDSHAYVLLNDYVPWNRGDSSPLFYAWIDDDVFGVNENNVYEFLFRCWNRTFITYDAVAFHTACLTAAGNTAERQAVWDLSRQFRLWDIALLEMRINYAFTGTVKKVKKAKGLETLASERCSGKTLPNKPTRLLGCLRDIVQNQVQLALDKLPLFHTFRDEWNIPEPVSLDAYCDILDSARAKLFLGAPTPECGIVGWPGSFYDATDFRRRDIVLTGVHGPFGIGIDLQAAIVADHLNKATDKVRPTLTEESLRYAESYFHKVSSRFREPSLKSCFEWHETKDGDEVIRRDSKGIVVQTPGWARRLYSLCSERPTFITAPLTYPMDRRGKESTLAVDWLGEWHLGTPLTDWLKLEAVSRLIRSHVESAPFAYAPFPALRSIVPEVLCNQATAPILQATPGHTFVCLRWNSPLTHTLKCTLFASYLLHRRYKTSDPYAAEFAPIYSPRRPYYSEEDDMLADTEKERPNYVYKLMSSHYAKEDAADLANCLDTFSSEDLVHIGNETLTSFRLLEHADAYARRIEKAVGGFPNRLLNLLYWTVLADEFEPLMTAAALPFSPIPMSTLNIRRVMRHDLKFQDHPFFFRSVNIDELILATVSTHFSGKDLAAPGEIGPVALNSRNKYAGWSLVNHLHHSNYKYFYAASRVEYDSFHRIRQASFDMERSELLERFVMSNAISCTGRVGKPIRYYEWIDADSRQLAEDVKSITAYSLLAAGYDLVLVSQDQVVIQTPIDGVEIVLPQMRKVFGNAIAQSLISAFPASNSPVDVSEYFVASEIDCRISPTWPIPPNEIVVANDDAEGIIEPSPYMFNFPNFGVGTDTSESDYVEVVSEEIAPLYEEHGRKGKKFRKRKNSKKSPKSY